MRKKTSAFLLTTLMLCITTQAFAFGYQQRITLHVASSDPRLLKYACFNTTDIFDASHCGDGASNKYQYGPKHVDLSFARFNPGDTMQGSCQNFKLHTPHRKGRLEIYLRIEKRDYLHSFVLTGCRADWVSYDRRK